MKKILRISILSAVLVCLASFSAHSKVTLPSFFSDNMVFQQNTQAAVWGWTDSGKKVTIRPSWTSIQYGNAHERLPRPACGGRQ